MDAALVRFMRLHEFLVVDVQRVQNLQSLLLVLSDEVENGLAEVLDHVLGLSLLLLLIILLPLELAELLLLGRAVIALEVVGLGLFGVVDEVGLLLAEFGLLVVVLIPVGAGTEDLEMIEALRGAGDLRILIKLIMRARATIRTGELLVEFLVKQVLSL